VRLLVLGRQAAGVHFAAAAAQQLGNQCIEVDTSAVPDDEWAEVFCRIQRFAILGRFGVI